MQFFIRHASENKRLLFIFFLSVFQSHFSSLFVCVFAFLLGFSVCLFAHVFRLLFLCLCNFFLSLSQSHFSSLFVGLHPFLLSLSVCLFMLIISFFFACIFSLSICFHVFLQSVCTSALSFLLISFLLNYFSSFSL